MAQSTKNLPIPRESKAVTYWIGYALPSENALQSWPPERAAYHLRETITRLKALLKGVRTRGRNASWLYDTSQHLVLANRLRRDMELLHEITKPH